MEGEGALDAIVFEQRIAAQYFFENFAGQVFAIQEDAELCFVHGGVVEDGEQDDGIGMVEQDGQIVAGGGEGAFAVLRKGVHEGSATHVSDRAVQTLNSGLGGKCRDGHGQWADAGVRRDVGGSSVEGFVEEWAAAKDATGLGKEKRLISQSERCYDRGYKFREFFRSGLEQYAGAGVAVVCGCCDDREHLGKDAICMGANLVLQLDPVAMEGVKNFVAERRVLVAARLTQAEHDGLPADVVGAAGIAEDGTQAPFASQVVGRVATNDGGAGAGDNHDAGDLLSSSQGHTEIGFEKHGGVGKLEG